MASSEDTETANARVEWVITFGDRRYGFSPNPAGPGGLLIMGERIPLGPERLTAVGLAHSRPDAIDKARAWEKEQARSATSRTWSRP